MDIVGSGRATVLTADPGNSQLILNLVKGTTTSNVSNLSVALPNGSSNTGLRFSRGKVTDVFIGGGTGATSATGLSAAATGTVFVNRSVIALGGSGSTGIDVQVGDIDVRDSAHQRQPGDLGPDERDDAGDPFRDHREHRRRRRHRLPVGRLLEFQLRGTSARALKMRGARQPALARPGQRARIDARNLTIVGDGGAGSVGVDGRGHRGHRRHQLRRDHLEHRDPRHRRLVQAHGAHRSRRQRGAAKLTVNTPSSAPRSTQSGPPADTEVTSNVPGNPDPLFNNPPVADYTPKPTSPLLDAADPRDLFPGESPSTSWAARGARSARPTSARSSASRCGPGPTRRRRS